MFEFSCHTWGFNDLTLPEAMGTIARLGFRYVDIGSGQHLNTIKAAADPRRIATDIISDLRVFNLKIADLYLMLPNIAHPDDTKRQREIDLFKAMVPLVKAIGAQGITVSPGIMAPVTEFAELIGEAPEPDTSEDEPLSDEEREQWLQNWQQERAQAIAYERSRDALSTMREAAAELPFSIEPHMDSVAQDPDVALQLVEDVDGLQLTVDWSHLVFQGARAEKRIPDLLPHARHIQIRQATRRRLQNDFESGQIDLNEVVQLLHEADYQGVVCIEYMQTLGWHKMSEVNTIQEVTKMRDALRATRDRLLQTR